MLCEKCGLNPATTQITKITSKGRQEIINLCGTCTAQARVDGGFSSDRFGPFSFFGGSPFFEFPSSLGSTPEFPRQEAVNVLDYFTSAAKKVIQEAATLAKDSSHQVLDTEHLLLALTEEEEIGTKLLQELGVKPVELSSYLKAMVPEGMSEVEIPEFSPRAKRVLQLAFDEARSLNHNYVGPEHIFLGLVREGEGLAAQTLKKFGVDLENARKAVVKTVGEGAKKGETRDISSTPTLDQFSRDLIKLAQQGKLDPVIGRQKEIERVVNILSRRTKNNPVLIGEPGVGKTAIAEGLAMRIAKKEVPESLLKKRVVALDLAAMVAGTKYRGEFEKRLKRAVDEIVATEGGIILFLDELHTLVGAGAAEGAIDAANILKPALSRGELQAIGATTLGEYKKYVEKDAALERRFQPIIVPENSVDETVEILKGLRDRYEAHHRVKILEEAIIAAAELSDRYVSDRFLPDKAIDLIDEASAEVRLRSIAPPENLKQVDEGIKKLKQEKEAAERAKRKKLEIRKIEQQLEDMTKTRDEIKDLWEKTKGTEKPEVTVEDVAEVLSKMTGIPVAKLTEQEREQLMNLEAKIHERIVDQEEAVKIVSEAIRRARVGLKDPRRPIGSFMFLGPTGVGKTELTRVLALVLYGSEESIVRLDMSEYQERHTVARLIGSPPGYVGFEEGGQLTERVRRKPYSIILLDEIEKAHPDVFNLLLQIMDEGRLTDGKGRTIDFKNVIIIMTSNLGGKIIQKAAAEGRAIEEIEEELEGLLRSTFRPEFLNRVDEFVTFKALTKEHVLKIVDLLLEGTSRLLSTQKITIEITPSVKKYLAEAGFDLQFGARPLKRVIQREIENPLSEKIIREEFKPGAKIRVMMNKVGEIVFEKK